MVKAFLQMGLDLHEVDDYGCKPLTSAVRVSKLPSKALDSLNMKDPLCYFISQYDDDDLEELMSSAYPTEDAQRWFSSPQSYMLPAMFKQVGKRCPEAFATPQIYQYVNWSAVRPRMFLDIVLEDGIEPATLRSHLRRPRGSIHEFTECYFERYSQNCSEEGLLWEKYLSDWRELTRWVFRGISIEELCADKVPSFVHCGYTALSGALGDCADLLYDCATPRDIQAYRRRIEQALVMWAEDMELAGVDLLKYGRAEAKMLSRNSNRLATTFADWDCAFDVGSYSFSLTYGKNPQDWKLHWDFWVEEFAGDFHEMVENQRYRIPGAWVYD